jgi:hypothetical protein
MTVRLSLLGSFFAGLIVLTCTSYAQIVVPAPAPEKSVEQGILSADSSDEFDPDKVIDSAISWIIHASPYAFLSTMWLSLFLSFYARGGEESDGPASAAETLRDYLANGVVPPDEESQQGPPMITVCR